MNKPCPRQLEVLDYFVAAGVGKPIPRPEKFDSAIWRSALRRLRERGYRIDADWVGRNTLRYTLQAMGEPIRTPDEMRLHAMFRDIDYDILADIIAPRVLRTILRARA